MGKPATAKPGTLAQVRELAALMRQEHIIKLDLDVSGKVTEIVLSPSALLLDERRRQETVRLAKSLVAAERADGKTLPVEPGNPLREKLARERTRTMFDGKEVDEADRDQYAHVEGEEDAFAG